MTKDLKKIIGTFGETLVCNFLEKKGYRIIGRNIKLSYLELDIIAEKNKKYFFIEVKTRTNLFLGEANQALKSVQIKKLKKAIVLYSVKNKINLNRIQLDFISVDINKNDRTAKIKHYKDIF